MARITEASLDEVELGKLRRPAPARPRPVVNLEGGSSVAALVLLVGGAIVGAAPDLLPQPAGLLGIGAVALGGWLARGPRSDVGAERSALAKREAELNRVLTAFAIRGNDVLVELARAGSGRSSGAQPGPDDGPDRRERHRLSAVPHVTGPRGTESLEPDADDGALG